MNEISRICMVTQSFSHTSIGGLERYLDNTIKKLLENQIKVFVVSVSFEKDTVEKHEDLTIFKKRFMNTADKKNTEKNGRQLFKFLDNLIKKEGIELVSGENIYTAPIPHVLAVNMTCFNHNIPLVLRIHSFLPNELQKSLLKNMMWKKIISVSRCVTENVYNMGLPIKKLATVYPGVDTKMFSPGLGKAWLRSRIGVDDDSILILHASRIITRDKSLLDEKGISTLLKAASTLIPIEKRIKVLIAAAKAPAPWKEFFDHEIKRIYDIAKLYNIEDHVIVHCFEMNEMPFVYNGSDIFVMATHNEAFGLSYAEALSCGLPVIGTSVGGIPEIISNSVNGYLIEPNNPVELAKRIGFLIEDEKKMKSFKRNARRTVIEKFNLEKQIKHLLGIYSSLIS